MNAFTITLSLLLPAASAFAPRFTVKQRTVIRATPFDDYKFRPISEDVVSREMGRRYHKDEDDFAKCDVVIVGAGSAGLCAACKLYRFKTFLFVYFYQSCGELSRG